MNHVLPDTATAPAIGRVRADPALNIYSVAAFAALCRTELERFVALQIDLSAVAACDTLGIQVLLSARRTAELEGKSVEFVNVTTSVRRAAAAVACESLFNPNPATP